LPPGNKRRKASRQIDPRASVPLHECPDHIFSLHAFERADGINESTSRLQPSEGSVEEPCLKFGGMRDRRGPRTVQNFGVAPKCAGRRTWCIEEDGIELPLRSPFQCVGMDKLGRQPRPIEVCPQTPETIFGEVDGSDPMTRS